MESKYTNLINKWSEPQCGVFTLGDFSVLFSDTSRPNLFKRLNKFEQENLLINVKRGLYATPDTSLQVISSRICPNSYISFGNVLAQNLIIGSVPIRRVQAVKVGPARTYDFELGKIEQFSISPKLYFGFETKNGVQVALPEKAFLDACYFYYKGKRFAFDLDTDVDMNSFDSKRIEEYLSKYDRRFITFFKKRWNI